MLLHQNSSRTWMKCTEMSQRIKGSLWWTSATILQCCQISVCVFWGGRESSKHKLGCCRMLTAAVQVHSARVTTLLDTNWQWTCVKLLGGIGVASSNHKILTQNLKLQKICAQRVPHSLTGVHMWQYMETTRLHLSHYKRDGEAFLCWILTVHETWARSYEPELQRQSNKWHQQGLTCSQKYQQEKGQLLVTFSVAYNYRGIPLAQSVPLSTTANAV
jgi:hypothetical protein